jgi:hypothetical protein
VEAAALRGEGRRFVGLFRLSWAGATPAAEAILGQGFNEALPGRGSVPGSGAECCIDAYIESRARSVHTSPFPRPYTVPRYRVQNSNFVENFLNLFRLRKRSVANWAVEREGASIT